MPDKNLEIFHAQLLRDAITDVIYERIHCDDIMCDTCLLYIPCKLAKQAAIELTEIIKKNYPKELDNDL